MNEGINLCKILKDCPKGMQFYSTIFGEDTYFVGIDRYKGNPVPITICGKYGEEQSFKLSPCGHPYADDYGECCLWPSKDCRDWSKWKCTKPKFDPKALRVFDRVLVRASNLGCHCWYGDFVNLQSQGSELPCVLSDKDYEMIIPYNDETKHLVGTSQEAPEYYRYWED